MGPLAERRGPLTPGMPSGRSLNPLERTRLIAEILSSYVHARTAMRRNPIEAAVRTLREGEPIDASDSGPIDASDGEPVDARDDEHADTLAEAHRLGRAVQRTLALAPGDTRCLTRSLVLTQLLARRGIPARLVIGARTTPSFLAHAWVEYAGQPVLPAGEGSFGRLVEL